MLDGIVVHRQELRQALGDEVITRAAEKSRFTRRQRKFKPVGALWSFVTAFGSGKAQTLSDIWRAFMDITGESIAYKAFHDRLSNHRFPEFLRLCLEGLMTELGAPQYRSVHPKLKRFDDIVAHDGSSFALEPALRDSFPGRFTTISPAAVEIHCTYSVYSDQALSIAIAADRYGERQFLPEPGELENQLLLIDRGYLDYKYFRAVEEAGGHYITRARDSRFNPTIVKCLEGLSSRHERRKLADVKIPKRSVDLQVKGTSEKGHVYYYRLVLFWVPEKRKHIRFITSLPHEQFSPDLVSQAYRLRWQIELFFKECKSFTQLKRFPTKNPFIAEALIWASLIAAALRRHLVLSAFENDSRRPSPFIAAQIAWTYLRDLARAAVRSFRRFLIELRRVLQTLNERAARTNPNRCDTQTTLSFRPASGYG